MRVSTAALLLKVMSVDHRILANIYSPDSKETDTRYSILGSESESGSDINSYISLGYMVATSIAGALLAKLLFSPGEAEASPIKSAADIPAPSLTSVPPVPPVPTVPTVPTVPIVPAVPSTISRGSQITGLASPSSEVDTTIRAAALKEQIDYALLYSVIGSESSFRTEATAGTSSAKGLGQFTASTWSYLTKKVYPELKYTDKDRTDPAKSATLTAKYLKIIQSDLTTYLGKTPTTGQTYLGYFMGPTGARKFLKALAIDSSQLGSKLFPNQARANKNIFYDANTPLTLQQTLDRLEGKVGSYYAQAGTVKRTTVATVSKGSSGSSGDGNQIIPTGQSTQIAVVSPATSNPAPSPIVLAKASQVSQVVTPADLPSANKVAKYAQEDIPTVPSIVPSEGEQPSPEVTYIRDKQNRITVIQG
jgi:Transglycosylase SLT domain